MRRLLPLGTSLAVLTATILLAGPAGASAPDRVSGDTAKPVKVATRFALKAAGFGTRVDGGQLPAASGTTGYQVIGCTNKAGITRDNYEADVTLPGLGTVSGVKTKTWTRYRPAKKEVSVYSMHNVAAVHLGAGLSLTAVNSLSRVWHDPKGFHTETTTSIGSIKLAGQTIPIPTPDTPITIPGVVSIAIGDHNERKDKDGAYASANAVDIRLLLTDTRVRVSHTAALMGSGITYGRFSGQSNATQVHALDENVKSGPTPLSYMPCQGTKGETRIKSVASVDLAGQIVVGAAQNRQMGKQDKEKATGFEESSIASITLGPLTINAIKARANVTRFKSGKVVKDADGTTIGEIVVNGEAQAIPDPGQALEIPGLLKLEANVIEKTKKGIDVVAVRITLLDGTGAVIDLGHARLLIKPSRRIM